MTFRTPYFDTSNIYEWTLKCSFETQRGTIIFLNYFRAKFQGYSWTDVIILILISSRVNFSLSSLLCILYSSVVEPPHLANLPTCWHNVPTQTSPYCGDSLMFQWCSMCFGNVIVKYSKYNLRHYSKCLCGRHVLSQCVPCMFADVTVLSSSFLRALLVSVQTIRKL